MEPRDQVDSRPMRRQTLRLRDILANGRLRWRSALPARRQVALDAALLACSGLWDGSSPPAWRGIRHAGTASFRVIRSSAVRAECSGSVPVPSMYERIRWFSCSRGDLDQVDRELGQLGRLARTLGGNSCPGSYASRQTQLLRRTFDYARFRTGSYERKRCGSDCGGQRWRKVSRVSAERTNYISG